MNTPHLPDKSLIFQSRFSQASSLNQGRGANTTTVMFNARDVTHYDLSRFFMRISSEMAFTLAVDTCNKAEKVHGKKIWKRDNLDKDLEAYDLPRDFTLRVGMKHRKPSAIFNVFLKVKYEGEKAKHRGRDGHDMPMAQNLCDFLNRKEAKEGGKNRDPHFVSMDFFVGEMNRYQQTMNIMRLIDSLDPESQYSRAPDWPPAENPTFTMARKLPLPSAQTITPSAPPNYDACDAAQAEMRLAGLNALIAYLQRGLKNDFQSQPFKDGMRWAEQEMSQFGVNLPVNLQEQYGETKANIESLQKQLQGMNEMVLVNKFYDKIDMLKKSLSEKEPKTNNLDEIKTIERQANDLANQINKLSSKESEYEKAELQDRVKALKVSISGWLAVVGAFDTLIRLKSYLDGFQFQKSLQDADLFSKKLDEFDERIRNIPPGEARNELMSEAGILRNSFSDIQKSVKQKQLIDELVKAEF